MSVTETVEGTAAKFLLAELLEVSHGVGSHLTAFVSGADGNTACAAGGLG